MRGVVRYAKAIAEEFAQSYPQVAIDWDILFAGAVLTGDFRRVVLGTAVMSFFVVVVNRMLWRPLYWYAERKFRLT